MSGEMLRRWMLPLLSLALPAFAADSPVPKVAAAPDAKQGSAPTAPKQPADRKDAMAASIELQRASVRKQIPGAPNATASFFTVPWLSPPPVPPQQQAGCASMPDSELDPLVAEAAQSNQLKPELIRAVIRQESASRPCAVSEKGAMGLMQLMPSVADHFGVRDPFDPGENVRAGSKLLKQLVTHFKGDLRPALAAYNAGLATVPESGAVPDIPETRKYVQAILNSLGKQ